MDLEQFDKKYVRIEDIYGNTHIGLARYGTRDFLFHEYGEDEDGIFIEDFLTYKSQIASIEETAVHGTAELRTDRLLLRKYHPEDAGQLYEYFGKDPEMYKYSGWNPYATMEMTRETVSRFIESYSDEHSYSWVMDANGDDVVIGTIGAYDYEADTKETGTIKANKTGRIKSETTTVHKTGRIKSETATAHKTGRIKSETATVHKTGRIEVGFSVIPAWQGRGLATEALKKVLEYLTENEGFSCVTAWCASENEASRKVLEKAGMQLVRTETAGLIVRTETDGSSDTEIVYDKLIFEYITC